MLIDASELAEGSELRADVCIIGGGPAGRLMARRPAEARLSVACSRAVASTGRQRHALGGWCRPLDTADLAVDWPLGYDHLVPYLRVAGAELLLDEAAVGRLLARTSAPLDVDPSAPTSIALGEAGIEPITYEVSPMREDFGVRFRTELDRSLDVRVVTGATVTDIRLAPASDRVERVVTASGAVVRAGEFVLAAGGLENPRLLLAATSDRPAGLGNEHDVVGRYFMEHVHGAVGHLALGPRSAADPLLSRLAQDPAISTTLRALAATPRAKADTGLQALSVMATPAPYGVWHPLIDLHPGLSVPLERVRRRMTAAAARDSDDAALTPTERAVIATYRHTRTLRSARALRQVHATVLGRGAEAVDLRTLYVRAEQRPQRDSRMRLSTTRDRFGVPQVELDWRLTAEDTDSVGRWVEWLRTAAGRLGDATVLADPPWRDTLEGGPHHMGTTRMSTTPRTGVVDEHCRVHSVANLHVAGSSVFPTGGYANPTFTWSRSRCGWPIGW